MDLLYLLYSLLRKKWVILLCTFAGCVAGFVFYMFRPKEYVSLAQYSTGFTMEQKVKIKQEETFNLYEIDIRFSNVNVAFASDKVLGMLAYKLLLHDLEDSAPFRTLTEKQKSEKAFTNADMSRVKQVLRNKIATLQLLNSYNPDERVVMDLINMYGYDAKSMMKQLDLQRVGRTDFINIFANSENPHLSAYMANTSGEQLIRFFNEIYGFRTQSASGKLDSLVASKKQVMDSLNRRLEKLRKDFGPTSSGEKDIAAMQMVQELYGKYQEETSQLNKLKGELRAVEQQINSLGGDAPTTGSTTGGNNREIKRLQDRNIELDRERNDDTKTDAEKRRIQDEIDNNTTKIIALQGSRPGTDRIEDAKKKNTKRDELMSRKIELQQLIVATEINVNKFEQEKNKYESLIGKGGDRDVILNEMQRDVDLATKEYEGLRSSLQASLDLNVNPENNFKQTLVGMPADKPNPSRKLIVSGLAGFLMFFFSCFLILLLEFLDSSYKTPTIFQRSAKMKMLSAINAIDLKRKTLQEYLHQDGGETDPEKRIFLENVRKLRFELENSKKKVFLVTSTRPKEGKSVVIESLASSFSLAHKKVLIIDANFSNNTLTEKFGVQPALEHFSVNGQPNAMDKILSVTGATTIPNTDIIGCNEGNYTPSEILPKNNLFESIDRVAANYDVVFIECAALNNHADTKELTKYADGIIAVVAATSGAAQSDKESLDYLRSNGDKLVGAVFNKVQKDNMDL
jgi:polysaccharide biosynthesis transport protein